MQLLRTAEAAGILSVTAKTLHNWESRYGFPQPMRTEGRQRLYRREEILALRHELIEQGSIGEAVACAQAHVEATSASSLTTALEDLDDRSADRVMEAVLGLRPVERAVEDLLLPAMREVSERRGERSVELAYAIDWATDWLRRASRMTLLPASFNLLIINACGSALDPNRVWTSALSLALRRRGAGLIEVPASVEVDDEQIGARAIRATIVCGNAASAIPEVDSRVLCLHYRRLPSHAGAGAILPATPSAAADAIVARAILSPGRRSEEASA